MRRNQKNFEMTWYAADLAGAAFRSSWRRQRFHFPKPLSVQNRGLLRSLGWREQIQSVGVALKESGRAGTYVVEPNTLSLQFAVTKNCLIGVFLRSFGFPSIFRSIIWVCAF